jgi:phytoene dehydrogenase-like protein
MTRVKSVIIQRSKWRPHLDEPTPNLADTLTGYLKMCHGGSFSERFKGIAQLTKSVLFRARGHSVTVFERSSWLGGKAAVLEHDGFRFDMGPTILTLPSVLRRIFAEAGERLEDYLDLVCLDPQWRSFFADGSTLDLVADTCAMQQHINAFAPDGRASAGYERFMQMSARLHDISERFFFWTLRQPCSAALLTCKPAKACGIRWEAREPFLSR